MHRERAPAAKRRPRDGLRLQLPRASEEPIEVGVQLGYGGGVEQGSGPDLRLGRREEAASELGDHALGVVDIDSRIVVLDRAAPLGALDDAEVAERFETAHVVGDAAERHAERRGHLHRAGAVVHLQVVEDPHAGRVREGRERTLGAVVSPGAVPHPFAWRSSCSASCATSSARHPAISVPGAMRAAVAIRRTSCGETPRKAPSSLPTVVAPQEA